MQNRMPIAGEERHIHEEGKANAEKVADNQADEEGRGLAVQLNAAKSA